MALEVNKPELAHYVVGGMLLLGVTPIIMNYLPVRQGEFGIGFWAFAAAWILAYIIIDQMLHVVLMKKQVSIVGGKR